MFLTKIQNNRTQNECKKIDNYGFQHKNNDFNVHAAQALTTEKQSGLFQV
jgi:hypothetical protein